MKKYEYIINIDCPKGDYLAEHNIDFNKLPPIEDLLEFNVNIKNPHKLILYDGKIDEGVFKLNIINEYDDVITLNVVLSGTYKED